MRVNFMYYVGYLTVLNPIIIQGFFFSKTSFKKKSWAFYQRHRPLVLHQIVYDYKEL